MLPVRRHGGNAEDLTFRRYKQRRVASHSFKMCEKHPRTKFWAKIAFGPAWVDFKVAEWQFSSILLEVIGMSGNTMIRKELAKASQTEILDMTGLPPGIYILKAQAKGGVAQQKIIKR